MMSPIADIFIIVVLLLLLWEDFRKHMEYCDERDRRDAARGRKATLD